MYSPLLCKLTRLLGGRSHQLKAKVWVLDRWEYITGELIKKKSNPSYITLPAAPWLFTTSRSKLTQYPPPNNIPVKRPGGVGKFPTPHQWYGNINPMVEKVYSEISNDVVTIYDTDVKQLYIPRKFELFCQLCGMFCCMFMIWWWISFVCFVVSLWYGDGSALEWRKVFFTSYPARGDP